MDLERIKRRQSLKVIISEAVMVIAVILMVTILAFIVSGYWVGSDFKIERQGLLQVSSIPTGANVEIDGASSWLQRTNTSKVLSSGEHKVVLTKDGYDSWAKTVSINEGLLYRLNYPRLFLKDRQPEEALEDISALMVSISRKHEAMLVVKDITNWDLVDLTSDPVTSRLLDVSKYFSTVGIADNAAAGLFTGKVLNCSWSGDDSHVLFKIDTGGGIEWVLIDVKNITNSINLTKSFRYDFDDIEIINDSSSQLLASQNHDLRKIDLSSRSVSSVLVEGVTDFNYHDNEVIFSAQKPGSDDYYIGILNLSNDKIMTFDVPVVLTSPVEVAISRFYDDKYIIIITNDAVLIFKREDFSSVASFELKFVPTQVKIGTDGGFILLNSGTNLATIDMESLSMLEWQIEGSNFGWLDDHMIYTVNNGELIVYDYDGINRRTLSKNVSARFPVTITDNKWLYYFSDNNLMREWLIPR